MTEEAKAARRSYKRKWAKEHPEKVKQHQERYWQKKAAKASGTEEKTEEQGEARPARV